MLRKIEKINPKQVKALISSAKNLLQEKRLKITKKNVRSNKIKEII